MREIQLQLQVKPTVVLRLTPQMRLSLAVLQKPLLELKAQVDQVLAENPFLEAEEPSEPERSLESLRQSPTVPEDDWLRPEEDESAIDTLQARHEFLMSLPTTHASLQEHVLTQFHVSVASPEDLWIGETLVGHLDHAGYLAGSIADIAAVLGVTEQAVTRVLEVIQAFDPVGIGARTLQECLLIQLKARGREGSLAWRLVRDFWNDLGTWRLPAIAKQAGTSLQAVQEAAQEIVSLEPKPGRPFGAPALPLVPDLAVKRVDGRLEVQCLNGCFPKLKVRTEYRPLLRTTPHEGPPQELKQKFHEAVRFVNALHARERTLEQLARVLVDAQTAFFEKGPTFLKPLTAKALAKRLGWHASTVSRAIAGKVIATPVGLFPLKAFFSSKKVKLATGAETVNVHLKERVKDFLLQDNGTKRLSDQAVAERLKAEGIAIARRTVTKYRQALDIPSSRVRKHSR